MVNTADSMTEDLCVIDLHRDAGKWPHLKPADGSSVDIYIRLDHPDLHFFSCDIRGKQGEPSVRKIVLGWNCVSPPA